MCLGDRVSDQHRRADGVGDGRGGAGACQPKWGGPGERDEVRNRLLEPLDVDGGEDHDLRPFHLHGATEIRQGGVGAQVDDPPSVSVQNDAEGKQR